MIEEAVFPLLFSFNLKELLRDRKQRVMVKYKYAVIYAII